MDQEIPFRIIINNPLPGVEMMVQKGKADLLGPVTATESAKVFEFSMRCDLGSTSPNFLGPFAQGPKDSRFVYVNSGTYAGQHIMHWGRRAKLSVMSISKEMVESVLKSPGSRLETTVEGVARDGGPVCASVKGLEWRIAGK